MRCARIQRHGVVLVLELELATATALQGDGTCAAARGPYHLPPSTVRLPLPPGVLYCHHTRCKDCNSGTKARPLSESELTRGTEGGREMMVVSIKKKKPSYRR